jgi:3-oxoacyl-[acyl-carrier protein] reductase
MQQFFTEELTSKKMKTLENKVAVITGASKGIGAAIAKAFAAEGAKVVVNYSSSKIDAEKVVSEITDKGGVAIAVQGSVTKEVDIASLFEQASKAYGPINILVNNAGIYRFNPIENVTAADFHDLFGTNVLGLLLTTQGAVKVFNENGGCIINISSNISSITPPGTTLYSGTKGAVDAITHVLAKELGPKKIRVNSINPGLVITEGTTGGGFIGSEFETEMIKVTPLGRTGVPTDISDAAVLLASENAHWITSENIIVSGGVR